MRSGEERCCVVSVSDPGRLFVEGKKLLLYVVALASGSSWHPVRCASTERFKCSVFWCSLVRSMWPRGEVVEKCRRIL